MSRDVWYSVIAADGGTVNYTDSFVAAAPQLPRRVLKDVASLFPVIVPTDYRILTTTKLLIVQAEKELSEGTLMFWRRYVMDTPSSMNMTYYASGNANKLLIAEWDFNEPFEIAQQRMLNFWQNTIEMETGGY